ncbi:hypothetical protein LOTGIDRAFT_96796, partial [Lottia gigantea]
ECWKCGRQMTDPAELFYCKCGIVQKPASNLTYFQLFGLNEDFDVDLKPLSEKYIELQKQLHPDKFSQASETEKSHAADQSSLVNKAYSVLTKPLHRAIYMLELHDNPIEESSAISDPEFLMEIMELNEELAEVDSPEDLKIFEEQNESNIVKNIQEISAAFKSKNIPSAHELAIKLQYYSNISEKIKDLKR